jgi:hypothetical protein
VKERLDLNEMLELAKHDLEVSISQKQAVITVTHLPVVKGVRVQFYQIFLNLLSNALKFATPGERVQIDITSRIVSGASDLPARLAERDGSFHHITIRDNGIGFSTEDAAGIFEVFRRLHPKQTYSGTGIGLAIVKKVIENHKGMVVAEGCRLISVQVSQITFPYSLRVCLRSHTVLSDKTFIIVRLTIEPNLQRDLLNVHIASEEKLDTPLQTHHLNEFLKTYTRYTFEPSIEHTLAHRQLFTKQTVVEISIGKIFFNQRSDFL